MSKISLPNYHPVVRALTRAMMKESQTGILIPLYLMRLILADKSYDRGRVLKDLDETVQLLSPLGEIIAVAEDPRADLIQALITEFRSNPLAYLYLVCLKMSTSPADKERVVKEMRLLLEHFVPLQEALSPIGCVDFSNEDLDIGSDLRNSDETN